MKYYLDTNICVFLINAKYPRLSAYYLTRSPNEIKIPSVVLYELYYGVEKSQRREQNLAKLKTFLSEIEIISFDKRVADIAGIVRASLEKRGMIIGGNDLLIAATVLANNGTMVTNNTHEFSRVEGLALEDWVEGTTP